jgi:hypothetical protein
MSAPLVLDSSTRARQFVVQNYTHPRPASQFEIFIRAIRFSDAAARRAWPLARPASPIHFSPRFILCNSAARV